jgi:hypothetical protein
MVNIKFQKKLNHFIFPLTYIRSDDEATTIA